ncbi:6,7-dimethyl-8-ribityllumazine synthase [Zavarzinia sp. CC-PAN008]|uniref:6,7-dimethyl-8-ribityllumazine synthase n=1 Tax=Zavarzinia sp. CC-PAN008 TaxID=3243332 RepID=UPI003F747BCF
METGAKRALLPQPTTRRPDGRASWEGSHILIIEARYYEGIVDGLVEGATAVLDAANVTYERVVVPGAFEIPAVVRFAVRAMDVSSGRIRYDGYVALGCVIRGETSHFDYVCGESARGLQDMATKSTLAIGYGILTVDTEEQAWARARMTEGDRGGAAARAAISMIDLKARFGLYFPR